MRIRFPFKGRLVFSGCLGIKSWATIKHFEMKLFWAGNLW